MEVECKLRNERKGRETVNETVNKMQTLQITKIFRSWKDKQGKPYMTKDGREYERLAIKTREYGDAWMSGFGNRVNSNWREGDTVEVNVDRVQKDGKEYLNFSMPNIWDTVHQLEARVGALEEAVLAPKLKVERTEEVAPEDLPF